MLNDIIAAYPGFPATRPSPTSTCAASAKKASRIVVSLARVQEIRRGPSDDWQEIWVRANPQAARHPGQKKSGLSPTHFSVLLRSALKAKPKDKFVCSFRIRRFPVEFQRSPAGGETAAFPSIKEDFSFRL